MSESIEDIIAGYVGKQEPVRHTLDERPGYAVVTDPNTMLLQELRAIILYMSGELSGLRAELYDIRKQLMVRGLADDRYRDPFMRALLPDLTSPVPPISGQFKGLQDIINKSSLQDMLNQHRPKWTDPHV